MKALQYYLLALNTSDTFFTQETKKCLKNSLTRLRALVILPKEPRSMPISKYSEIQILVSPFQWGQTPMSDFYQHTHV